MPLLCCMCGKFTLTALLSTAKRFLHTCMHPAALVQTLGRAALYLIHGTQQVAYQ
jgi:hypothetical protein